MSRLTNGMKRISLGLALGAATLFSPIDLHANPAEPNILHFIFSSMMTNTGVVPGAKGIIAGNLARQGNASNQRLTLTLTKLTPNTTYQLVAFIDDDIAATNVAGFTTSATGTSKIVYVKKSQGNPSAGGQLLPDVLDPLNHVRELDIVNGNAQAVLRVSLNNPDKLQYLVKRPMDNTGLLPTAAGSLQINATSRTTQFRLTASGLHSNTDYVLTFNGIPAQTNTTDRLGKLNLKGMPGGAPDVLAIHAVGLTDLTSNLILTAGGSSGIVGIPVAGQAPVALRSAAAFAVLAGSEVANTGLTIVKGNLGVSAGSAVTGFHTADAGPGVVHGTIYTATPGPAATAQHDLTTAFNDAAGRTVGAVTVAGNLGGQTLTPGLYKSTSSLAISSGNLTLDARGDAQAVFIFQIASALTTTSGRQVILSGKARAANVFWQVGSSATLGTTTIFKGTIMADQSITLETGATLEGRALARIAMVTLGANTVTIPVP